MNKNIVIIQFENASPSGVVRYIQMLLEGLKLRNDFKIHVICLNTNIIFPKVELVGNKVIANIPFPPDSKPLRYENYWLTKYFEVVSDLLIPYFKNKEKVIWHVHELFLVKLANILKNSIGGYVLTHLHIIPWKFSIEFNENHFKKLYSQWLNNIFDLISKNQLENIAYPLSDRIICVSDSAKKHIISAYHIYPNKISVVYNGLDHHIERTLQKDKKETNEILFVGRISREKGVIGLLNALSIAYNRGHSYKLKLVGKCTGYMSSYIRKAYKQLDIEMLGVVSFNELKKLYSESTIGIIPSLHEQCSYVAIEMSMFGLPIIVSDVDALSEMFEDEINALKIPLLFDEDFGLELNEDKLADTIIRLMNEKALRQKLSKNAIKNYQEKFTLANMIENTISVYNQLIEQDQCLR